MISSLEQLADLASDGVTILVERDPKVKTAFVSVSGKIVMAGNYWDFTPECHGGYHYQLAELHGRWTTAAALADRLATFLVTKGATMVSIEEKEFDWVERLREMKGGTAA
jgi:NADPH:quinone reductase and related Zn-dependent oxidoreductases